MGSHWGAITVAEAHRELQAAKEGRSPHGWALNAPATGDRAGIAFLRCSCGTVWKVCPGLDPVRSTWDGGASWTAGLAPHTKTRRDLHRVHQPGVVEPIRDGRSKGRAA